MKKLGYMALAASMMITAPLMAKECGEPPLDMPTVPNGETATAEQIRLARAAVVKYSNTVDVYLACMDERGQVVLPYLTKDQKFRWEEDLASIHNKRRDLQTAMNQAIRTYRRASQEKK